MRNTSPLNRIYAGFLRLTPVKAFALSSVLVASTLLGSFVHPPKASAAPAFDKCGDLYLDGGDWPAELRKPTTGTDTGAGWTDFDINADQFVVYQTTANHTAGRNLYTILRAKTTTNPQITFVVESGLKKIRFNGSLYQSTIIAEPKDQYQFNTTWSNWGSVGHDGYETVGSGTTSGGTHNLDGIGVYCYAYVKNVQYAGSWTFDKLSEDVVYTEGANLTYKCDTFDIGCQIAKAWRGVGNTIADAMYAAMKGIASFFMPDGAVIKSDFDDLNTFLQAKLGFLVYPLTFLGQLFTAFGDTTNNWCTSSSCTKNFGNLFGQPFVVDLKVGATAYPTYWTYFLTMTRGLVVLALVLAIRKKYIGVVHK